MRSNGQKCVGSGSIHGLPSLDSFSFWLLLTNSHPPDGGERGKSVRIVRYVRLIRGCTARRVETRRGGLVEKKQQQLAATEVSEQPPALSDCKDFFLGQSEPAPTNAPVGRSVHRMGCIFSSSLNQSTFFGF